MANSARDETTRRIPREQIDEILARAEPREKMLPIRDLGLRGATGRGAFGTSYLCAAGATRRRVTVLVMGSTMRAAAAVGTAFDRAGYRVVLGFSESGLPAAAATLSDRCFVLPDPTTVLYAANVLAIARRAGASIVVPTGDAEMPPMAAAKRAFALANIRVLVPDGETIALCRDRESLLARLRGVVPVPRTASSVPDQEWGSWLVRDKDKLSGGPTRVATRHDEGQLRRDQMLVEYLPGGEIWVDVVRTGLAEIRTGRPVCVHRDTRTRVEGEIEDHSLLAKLAGHAAARIGLVGHATVRFRHDEIGLPVIVDVVPGFASASFEESGMLHAMVDDVTRAAEA